MCLICRKFRPHNLEPHVPTQLCLMFQGLSGDGGYTARCRIPSHYSNALLDDIEFNQPMFRSYVNSFYKVFDPETNIRNLYLWSDGTGLGKTFVACALLNEFNLYYVINSWKTGKQPTKLPTYFLDLTELQQLYNAFNRPNVSQEIGKEASAEYYRRLADAENALMLCVDDLGVRDATEGFRGDIHTVINKRVTTKSVTIYTSNYKLEDLLTVYEKRLYDRVRDNTIEICFDSVGKSRRGVK